MMKRIESLSLRQLFCNKSMKTALEPIAWFSRSTRAPVMSTITKSKTRILPQQNPLPFVYLTFHTTKILSNTSPPVQEPRSQLGQGGFSVPTTRHVDKNPWIRPEQCSQFPRGIFMMWCKVDAGGLSQNEGSENSITRTLPCSWEYSYVVITCTLLSHCRVCK